MKAHLLRSMFIVGATALALAASTVVLPSVADASGAAGVRPQARGQSAGRMGANYRGHATGRGGYSGYGGYRGGYGGGYGGGYYGGYSPGYCGPIQLTLGLCGPWGY